jgi:hypothetical protein
VLGLDPLEVRTVADEDRDVHSRQFLRQCRRLRYEAETGETAWGKSGHGVGRDA